MSYFHSLDWLQESFISNKSICMNYKTLVSLIVPSEREKRSAEADSRPEPKAFTSRRRTRYISSTRRRTSWDSRRRYIYTSRRRYSYGRRRRSSIYIAGFSKSVQIKRDVAAIFMSGMLLSLICQMAL